MNADAPTPTDAAPAPVPDARVPPAEVSPDPVGPVTSGEPHVHEEPHVHDDAYPCPNCDAENRGEFCSRCGQKRVHEGDLSVKHAWHHVFHETLHLDGKFLTTVRHLLTRPGQLTLDFVENRRARHTHPVQLFVLFSGIFILSASDTFNVAEILRRSSVPPAAAAPATPLPLAAANTARPEGPPLPSPPGVPSIKSKNLDGLLRKVAAKKGEPYELYVEHLNQRLTLVLKFAYTFAIAVCGIWYALLFRGRFHYLAEHMVYSLHVASFGAIINTSSSLLNKWLFGGATWVIVLATALNLGYNMLAARRVYRERWWPIALKILLVAVLTNLVMLLTIVAAATVGLLLLFSLLRH